MANPLSSTDQSSLREHADSSFHALINWKSILAGLFIAFTFYVMLSALGAGVAGSALTEAIQNSGIGGIAVGSVIWMAVTTLIALAVGSYFAARTSTFITGRIGAAQGLVIAALFFSMSILSAATTVTIAGLSLGSLARSLGGGTATLVSNPSVQDTVGKALTNGKLKSDPTTVMQGLSIRLLRGDVNSAKTYLAYQSDLSTAEIDSRIDRLNSEFTAAVQNVSTKTAKAAAGAGWSIFIVMLLGGITAVTGGAMGARLNLRVPLSDEHGAQRGTERLVPQQAGI